MANLRESYSSDMRILMWAAFLAFIIFVSLLNNFFIYFMTKRIVKPLEPLGEGVR
jgi:nitrate/nitrite-specific signal transduction histidine kinase